MDNNVHTSIQPDLNKYDANTRVRFACISGFTGLDIEAVCLANGQWSSQQIPRCTRMYIRYWLVWYVMCTQDPSGELKLKQIESKILHKPEEDWKSNVLYQVSLRLSMLGFDVRGVASSFWMNVKFTEYEHFIDISGQHRCNDMTIVLDIYNLGRIFQWHWFLVYKNWVKVPCVQLVKPDARFVCIDLFIGARIKKSGRPNQIRNLMILKSNVQNRWCHFGYRLKTYIT